MAKNKLVKVVFDLINTDKANADGESRQDILAELSAEYYHEITFNRCEVTENGHQRIEVTVNGKVVAELNDADYIRYNTNINSAKSANLFISEEEAEDGSVIYGCSAILMVPELVSEEGREKLYKRKQKIILAMMAMFVISTIAAVIHKDFLSVIVGCFALVLLFYWGFIRDPKKSDKVLRFLRTGRRK